MLFRVLSINIIIFSIESFRLLNPLRSQPLVVRGCGVLEVWFFFLHLIRGLSGSYFCLYFKVSFTDENTYVLLIQSWGQANQVQHCGLFLHILKYKKYINI